MYEALGSAANAGLNFIGGMMNRESNRQHNEAQNKQAELNRKMQIDFAQHGIKWKVDDARDAGIHPLYALGAQTTSFSPVSVGGAPDTSLGNAMAAAGQDLSRAINTTRTSSERLSAYDKTVQNLTLQKMGLENDLLASQIAKLRQTSNPALPSIGPVPEADKYEDRPKLIASGVPLRTDPGSANAEDFEKRYGDIAQEIAGVNNMYRDYMLTSGGMSIRDILHSDRRHPVNKFLYGDEPWIVPGGLVDRISRRFRRHSSGW